MWPRVDNVAAKMQFIQWCIGAEEDENNSLRAAKMNVEEEYEERMTDREIDCFKVSFVVFALGYFLAPTTKCNHGSDAFWGSLQKPSDIANYNWSQYVLDMLVDSARKAQLDLSSKKKCSNVTGCPLLLQVYIVLHLPIYFLDLVYLEIKLNMYILRTKEAIHHHLQLMFLDNIYLGKLNRPRGVLPAVHGLTCEYMRRMVSASQSKYLSGVATHIKREVCVSIHIPVPFFILPVPSLTAKLLYCAAAAADIFRRCIVQ